MQQQGAYASREIEKLAGEVCDNESRASGTGSHWAVSGSGRGDEKDEEGSLVLGHLKRSGKRSKGSGGESRSRKRSVCNEEEERSHKERRGL